MPFFCRLMRFALYSLVLLSGCQSLVMKSGQTDVNYFPLETGHYVIYDVEERQFPLNATPVSRTYQLKERIGLPYKDVTGQLAYRLLRYRRATDSQPWQADSVWSARLVTNEAIRTENGRDFVQLTLPVSDQLTWDGNRYNQLGRNEVTASNAGQPYRVLTKQFDETVTISGQVDSTLTGLTKHTDVYARGVGLIYKERVNIQFCTATPACTGHAQIDYGTQQVYRIRTYGIE